MPERESLFGRDGDELRCPLIEGRVVTDQRQQHVSKCKACRQRRWMSQPPRLGNCCIALSHCLIWKAECKQDNLQMRLRQHVKVGPSLVC